jgi:hypothetical protein
MVSHHISHAYAAFHTGPFHNQLPLQRVPHVSQERHTMCGIATVSIMIERVETLCFSHQPTILLHRDAVLGVCLRL